MLWWISPNIKASFRNLSLLKGAFSIKTKIMKKNEKKDIIELFPLKTFITQEILNSKCSIGEQCLLNVLSDELHSELFWGLSIGHVGGILIGVYQNIVYNGKNVNIPFYLQRTDIKEPIEITFELRK